MEKDKQIKVSWLYDVPDRRKHEAGVRRLMLGRWPYYAERIGGDIWLLPAGCLDRTLDTAKHLLLYWPEGPFRGLPPGACDNDLLFLMQDLEEGALLASDSIAQEDMHDDRFLVLAVIAGIVS